MGTVMNIKRLSVGLVLLFSLILLVPAQSIALDVDLELLLAVDISGSINDDEYDTQLGGYEAAFRDTDIINGIINGGTHKSIAVSLVFWSSWDQQQVAINWTLINSAATSNAFADDIYAVADSQRPFNNRTGLGEAIEFSADQFSGDNGFESDRWVIDVSGDGEDNDWEGWELGTSDPDIFPASAGRDYALNTIGVDTINGLVFGENDLLNYYTTYVIGGTDAFAILVTDIDDFGNAVKDKLSREISPDPVPEPTTMLLFGLGLAGLAGFKRKLK